MTCDYCQHRAKKCNEIKREMNEDSDLDDDAKKRQVSVCKQKRKLWLDRVEKVDQQGPTEKRKLQI